MAQLVPDSKEKLAKFKNQVSSEMGVPFSDYNGNLTSKQCGSVGGEMVKRMVEQYEKGMKKYKKIIIGYLIMSILLLFNSNSIRIFIFSHPP